MKRKLFSTLLCAFALLLLMGAGVEQDSAAAAIVIEEESASADGSAQVLETGIQTGIEAQDTEEISADEIYLEAINSDGTQTSVTAEPAVALDHTLLVNGQPVPADTGKTVEQGTTYVALAAMAQTLDPSVTITWDGGSSTAAVQSAVLDLTAKVGQQYLVANGRYLYVPEGVRMEAGRVVVPLKELVKAFDAKLSWDPADGTTSITTGSGGIASGDSFYNQDDLFWLSRVVYAESGNQSLDGTDRRGQRSPEPGQEPDLPQYHRRSAGPEEPVPHLRVRQPGQAHPQRGQHHRRQAGDGRRRGGGGRRGALL